MNENGRFVYCIYDNQTAEIWGVYQSENECELVYEKFFEGFENISWSGINLTATLLQLLLDAKQDAVIVSEVPGNE